MKTVTGNGWRLALPEGLIAKDHRGFGYESGMIARGWIDEAPLTVVVQVKALETGFNDWVRQLSRTWLEHDGKRTKVVGAADAMRVDGVIEFDGLGAKDDREDCTTLLAKRGGRVWSLTIRTRPEDGIGEQIEPIVDSFELLEP